MNVAKSQAHPFSIPHFPFPNTPREIPDQVRDDGLIVTRDTKKSRAQRKAPSAPIATKSRRRKPTPLKAVARYPSPVTCRAPRMVKKAEHTHSPFPISHSPFPISKHSEGDPGPTPGMTMWGREDDE